MKSAAARAVPSEVPAQAPPKTLPLVALDPASLAELVREAVAEGLAERRPPDGLLDLAGVWGTHTPGGGAT
jgi:hypothetical protein